MARPAGCSRRLRRLTGGLGSEAGRAGCWVPPALLPESRTRRANAYLLWRSTVRVSTHDDDRSRITPKPRSRRRNDAEQPAPARPKTRRSKSPAPGLDPGGRPELMAIAPKTCLAAPCPSHCSQPGGLGWINAEAIVTAQLRRLVEPPALVPRPTTSAAPCHHRPFLPPFITSDNLAESEPTILAL
jgi:hypothetical protein